MVITPCVCPGWPPRPCVHFSYWEPTLLVHTEAYTGLSRSATDARFYRAVDVATLPGAHTIIRPSFIPATLANNINLGFPKLSQCMKPGFPPILWEWGTGSATGNYLWVWYQRRTCCIDPEEVCTSVARYRDPLLTVACARIKESPPSASPAFRRDPVTVNLRRAWW